MIQRCENIPYKANRQKELHFICAGFEEILSEQFTPKYIENYIRQSVTLMDLEKVIISFVTMEKIKCITNESYKKIGLRKNLSLGDEIDAFVKRMRFGKMKKLEIKTSFMIDIRDAHMRP